MAGDEHAVLRGHEVRLDVVGAHARGEGVGGEGVLGAVPGCAAVADHERLGVLAAAVGGRGPGHGGGQDK